MKRAALFLAAGLASGNLCAQKVGAGPTGSTTVGAGTTGTTASLPTTVTSTPSSSPSASSGGLGNTTRGIFISGQVVMADGSPVPQGVSIQRLCSGNPRTVAYADLKGQFTFQWNAQESSVIPDASEAGIIGRGIAGGGSSASGGSGSVSPIGCEIRANLAGYRSDTVNLGSRFSLDNPDVGMIVLHRNGASRGESQTVSATSLMAPKDARKAFDRGQLALMKNKPADAAKDFENAVTRYPRYADAWLNLGKLRLDQHQPDRAQAAFLKAIEADPKIIQPYLELGLLAAGGRNWEDARKYLDRVIRLDAANYPIAWYTVAVADYNLKKLDDAEKNVRQAMKLDPRHGIPREQYLLGLILEQKRDFPGAVLELTTYLKLAPAAPDVAEVEEEIRQLHKMADDSKQAAK